MNIIQYIQSIFSIKSDKQPYNCYESQSSYRVRGVFDHLVIDLRDINYEKCPLKLNKSSYQANHFSILLYDGNIWQILHAKKSIRFIWVAWNPTNERALIGESKKFAFREMSITFNGMDENTFLAQIISMEDAFGMNISQFEGWINQEIDVYEKVEPMYRSFKSGDKAIKFTFRYERDSKTPFKIVVNIAVIFS